MAQFNFFLNRQGPRGVQGIQGETGFSPTIEPSDDNDGLTTYKLVITNENNTFETDNLMGTLNIVNNGGTYLRYNQETGQISADIADAATTSTSGTVKLASTLDFSSLSNTAAITPASLADNVTELFQSSDNSIEITQDATTSKINLKGTPNLSNYMPLTGITYVHGIKYFDYLVGTQLWQIVNGSQRRVATRFIGVNGIIASQNTETGDVTIDGSGISGGSSYTAGDGINITNDEISLNIDSNSILSINSSGQLTANTSNFVDLSTPQTISARKTFNSLAINAGGSTGNQLVIRDVDGAGTKIVANNSAATYEIRSNNLILDGRDQWGGYAQGDTITVNYANILLTGTNLKFNNETVLTPSTLDIEDFIAAGSNVSFTTDAQGRVVINSTGGGGGGGSYIAGDGISISGSTISVAPATASTIGGVIPDGTTITIDVNGVISAVGGASGNYIENLATGTDALTILGLTNATDYSTNIGSNSRSRSNYATALGYSANALGDSATAIGSSSATNAARATSIGADAQANSIRSVAIGSNAIVDSTASNAIQIGRGTNATANSLSVGFSGDNWLLLDGTTGLIPDTRISSNIARASNIPVINSAAITTALGYTPVNPANLGTMATERASDYLTVTNAASTYQTKDNYIVNNSPSNNSIAIGNSASAAVSNGIAIGYSAACADDDTLAIGELCGATGAGSIAIGYHAISTSSNSIQLGAGTNMAANTFAVGSYMLLNTSTGKIPSARLDTDIARTASTADNTLSNVSSINSNSAVQTALDDKVNSADVWYDSTTSTLYIGVARQ